MKQTILLLQYKFEKHLWALYNASEASSTFNLATHSVYRRV